MTELEVNGRRHSVSAAPDTPLLYVLRNDLGLVGSRFGCGTGQCGACFVIVDGKALPSCDTPLWSVEKKRITTVEGLGGGGELHPVQKALLAEQAGQCGYCISGIAVAAAAFISAKPGPLRAAGARSARSKPLPLRRAQPRRARGAAGRQRDPMKNPRIRFERDRTVWIASGKVELGQGINTALAQIAAEELDVAFERIRVLPPSTAYSPDEGYTSGSMSVQEGGKGLREACVQVRGMLLAHAAELLGAPIGELTIEDGTIRAKNGAAVTYWECAAEADEVPPAGAGVKPSGPTKVVGKSAPRIDLPAKVAGKPAYVQDMKLPGMLHGRIVRPPHPFSRARIAARRRSGRRVAGARRQLCRRARRTRGAGDCRRDEAPRQGGVEAGASTRGFSRLAARERHRAHGVEGSENRKRRGRRV